MIGLARSTYYHAPGTTAARQAADAPLRQAIEAIRDEFPAYGYRRVTRELRRRGPLANHKRVARLMRESLLGPRPRGRYVLTTDSAHADS